MPVSIPATVEIPTWDEFAALEARVGALESGGGGGGPGPDPGPGPGPDPEPKPPASDPVNPLAPAAPTRPDVRPGSSGRVLHVGPGGDYETVAAAHADAEDGDTIQLAPDTPRQVFAFDKIVLIDGGGVAWDFTGVPQSGLAWQKGVIIPHGPAWHVRNFTLSNVGRNVGAQLIAPIRVDGTACWGVVEACTFRQSQNGFSAGMNINAMVELVDCLLEQNGNGDGLTHGLYVGDINTLRLTRVVSRGSNTGHAIKSRAWHTFATDCDFGTRETCLDTPNGGAVRVVRTKLRKEGAGNRRFLGYGEEGVTSSIDGNTFEGCTFDLKPCGGDPYIDTMGGRITFDPACQWSYDGRVFAQGGGTCVGLPG